MIPHVLNRFLTTTARAIYNEKCYPTAEEYSRVAQEVIQWHPFLASPVGSPYVSVNDLGLNVQIILQMVSLFPL